MKTLIKILLAIYILCCAAAYTLQEKIIFHPQDYPEFQPYKGGQEIEIPLEEGLTMNALLVPHTKAKKSPTPKSKGAILYLHGNTGNIRRAGYQIRNQRNRGYDILIPDYRGYGKTEGQPESDKQMLEDANKAYQYLKKNYNEKNIYIIGYSLGTGMASYIAKENNPAHLILIAPFTSLTDIKNKYLWMFPNFLLKYKLSNRAHLKNSKTPTTIIHGTNDHVVDYRFSEELKQLYPQVDLHTQEGIGHREIIFRISDVLDRVIP